MRDRGRADQREVSDLQFLYKRMKVQLICHQQVIQKKNRHNGQETHVRKCVCRL